MKPILIIYIVLYSLISSAQLVPNGQYIGLEKMSVWKYPDGSIAYWPGIIRYSDTTLDKGWYHEVTMEIREDSIWIKMVPVCIKNGKERLDSTGGFYSYAGTIYQVKTRPDTNVIAYMRKCTTCPTAGDGEPRYHFAIYHIKMQGKNFLADSDTENKIFFKKTDN